MFSTLYHVLLYQPLYNLLVFFYNVIPGHDIGLSIIFITLLIKLILLPLTNKSMQSQKALQSLQPKINEIKETYKDDKQKIAQATMELYRNEKVNPFSSCLPLLIQLPIFIAVYHVFSAGLVSQDFSFLYSFVSNPGTINPVSFGAIDLSLSKSIPGLLIALAAGIAQYFQAKSLAMPRISKNTSATGGKDEAMMVAMNKQMLYFMPLFTVFIGYTLPAGLVLYWLVTNLAMILQQHYYFGRKKNEVADVSGDVKQIEKTGNE